jgi:hypothetical protein
METVGFTVALFSVLVIENYFSPKMPIEVMLGVVYIYFYTLDKLGYLLTTDRGGK